MCSTEDPERFEIEGITCSIRVHSRSRRVRLKMVPHLGLVAVVPPGYDRASLNALIVRHREWIMDAMGRVGALQSETQKNAADRLPETVRFLFPDKTIQVRYERKYPDDGVSYNEVPGGILLISGQTGNTVLCRAVLQLWLKHKAAHILFPELDRLASLHGFSFRRPGIRLQQSRWGSCSTSGTITLNAKLLFLPSHLVRSVLLHELCHTVHMNHASAFRKLLESCNPDSRSHDIEMKTAFRYVPAWAALPA